MNVYVVAVVEASGGLTLTMLVILACRLGRILAALMQMLEDWRGTPARPGVDAVPGVMERLQSHTVALDEIRHEVFPNSGGSLRDSVAAIHEATTGHPDPGVTQP